MVGPSFRHCGCHNYTPSHAHWAQVEEALFYVAAVPYFSVVMGLEWLQAQNPQFINKCAIHHLHACVGCMAMHLDLDLPAEFVDYAKLLMSPIYSLSELELSALSDFIENNLQKGVYLAFYFPIGCASALCQEEVRRAETIL